MFFICLFWLRYKLHSAPGTAIRCCGGRGAQWGFPWIKHGCKSTLRNSQCPTGLHPAPSSSPSPSPQRSRYSDLLSPWTPFACFWGFFRWNHTGGYLLCLHLWLMVLCLWGSSKLLHVSVAPFFIAARLPLTEYTTKCCVFPFSCGCGWFLVLWFSASWIFLPMSLGGYGRSFFWVNSQE